MGVVATAAIKVTADISEFKQRMGELPNSAAGADRAIGRIGKSAAGTGLEVGRLRREFTTFAREVTGVPPIIAQVTSALGAFAGGNEVMLAIAATVGVAALAYEKLTESSRAAKKAQDDLNQSILAGNVAWAKGKAGDLPNQLRFKEADLARLEKEKSDLKALRKTFGAGVVPDERIASNADEIFAANKAIDQLRGRMAELTTPLNAVVVDMDSVGRAAKKSAEESAKAFSDFVANAKAQLGVFSSLRSDGVVSDTVNRELVGSFNNINRQLREMPNAATPARAALMGLRSEMLQNLAVARLLLGAKFGGAAMRGIQGTGDLGRGDVFGVGTSPPQSLGAGPLKDIGQKSGDKLMVNADKNASLIRTAIGDSAQTIASVVGSALNIGGGGRGSAVGSSLGTGLGSVIGTIKGGGVGTLAGGVVGVVAGLAGGLLGSAIGGLFGHHKKSVDNNTAAIQALTQAMELNAPSGFKVGRARYGATQPIVIQGDVHISSGGSDIKQLGRDLRSTLARGGVDPLQRAG